MSVTWVLEREAFDEAYTSRMILHLREKRLPHHLVYVDAQDGHIVGKAPTVEGPCVIYGSIGIDRLIARHGWRPGVFANPEAFRGSTYSKKLGPLFLNDDIDVASLGDVEGTMKRRGWHNAFIKPADDNKAFAGRLFALDEIAAWRARILKIGYIESDTLEVIVAAPKKILAEWRLVIVDGEVCDASVYRRDGAKHLERGATAAVREIAMRAHRLFQPAPIYVIDIALLEGEHRVVEYNTFNTADLYACDVGKVIDDVTAYVSRTWE